MRVLFDVNVVLDVLQERDPHVDAAAALWRCVERGEIEGLLPAHGVTTIFYLAQKERTHAEAKRMVHLLLSVFGIAAVNEEVLSNALALACPDFEDAVCAAAAKKARCDFLITRDPKGFRGSPIRVLDPVAALAAIRAL